MSVGVVYQATSAVSGKMLTTDNGVVAASGPRIDCDFLAPQPTT